MQVLTDNMQSFPVKVLSEFKGLELQSGQYLCRKIEKGTGKNSQGVVIAAPSIEEFVSSALNSDSILQGAYSWYLSQVEEVVKARISQGATSICTADFSVEVIAENIKAEEIKQDKVSKERISAWFVNDVSKVLYAAFSEKLGDSLTNEKANAILAQYKSAFECFAKREYTFSDAVFGNMNKALELLSDSPMKEYCKNKLQEFAPKSVDEWAL